MHVLDVVFEWLLAKVRVHHLTGRLQTHRWVQLIRQVPERDAQVVSVLRVETSVVHQIDATTDYVARSEGRSIWFTRTGTAERVAVIAVISVGLLVPAGQTVHLEVLRGQSDAHVAVAPLRNDLHLEVVQATGRRNRMRSSDRSCIVV